MTSNAMTGLWARTALLWFLITMCFGMYIGMTKQFHLHPSHAHMGVLGWLSSAAFATIYGVARETPAGKAPVLHWALHNIGVVVMTGSLLMFLATSNQGWEVGIPTGGLLVILAAIWLAVMMWGRLGRASA